MLQIGEKIRKCRRAMEMTQDELARKLGVASQTVSHWENGTTYPDIELLPVIARILGLSLDNLFGASDEDRQKRADELLRKLDEATTSCPPNEDLIINLVNEARQNIGYYPGMWRFTYGLSCVRHSERALAQIRLYVNDILECSTDEAERAGAVYLMTLRETEDNLREFIDKHAEQNELSKLGMLCTRYLNTGDIKKTDIVVQEMNFERIVGLLNGPIQFDPANPEKTLDMIRQRLRVINFFSGNDPDSDILTSLSGEIGVFVCELLHLGKLFSAESAAVGLAKDSLTALERVCDLLNRVMAIKGKIEMAGPAPWFDKITFTFEEKWEHLNGRTYEERAIAVYRRSLDGKDKFVGMIIPSMVGMYFLEEPGISEYVPYTYGIMRDDSQFKACADRLRALIETRPLEKEH